MTDGSVGRRAGGRKRRPLATAAIMLGALSFASTLAAIALAAVGSRLYSADPLLHWLSVWAVRAFLVAVTCGVLGMALGAVARRGGRVGAYGLAFAVIAAVLLPVWIRKPEAHLKAQCLSNTKELALAVSMYASDWDRYPEAAHWSDAVLPYVRAGVELRRYGPDIAPRGPASEETMRRAKETYRCPDAAAACAYAYNATLSRLFDGDLSAPDKVIAIFESDRGWNAHGGKELLLDFPRHFGGDNIGFADGHVRWYARQKPRGEARWNTVWPREYQHKDELQWQPALRRSAK
jgi:prepilin-type processing-associated H-X9-DG protein